MLLELAVSLAIDSLSKLGTKGNSFAFDQFEKKMEKVLKVQEKGSL